MNNISFSSKVLFQGLINFLFTLNVNRHILPKLPQQKKKKEGNYTGTEASKNIIFKTKCSKKHPL